MMARPALLTMMRLVVVLCILVGASTNTIPTGEQEILITSPCQIADRTSLVVPH